MDFFKLPQSLAGPQQHQYRTRSNRSPRQYPEIAPIILVTFTEQNTTTMIAENYGRAYSPGHARFHCTRRTRNSMLLPDTSVSKPLKLGNYIDDSLAP